MPERARTRYALLLLAALIYFGCHRQTTGEKRSEPPAKVDAPVKEADLNQIHLTEAAERRLGITVAPLKKRSILLSRLFGGVVSIPQGGSVRITAPLAGTLLMAGADLPRPGARITKGQTLVRLAPVFAGQEEILAPSERLTLAKAQADLAASLAEAEGQMRTAEARLQAAKVRLERAERLWREKAGSEQAYQEALASVRTTEAELAAARARFEMLGNIRLEMRPETAPALVLNSPIDGIISALHVRGNLEVPAGTPLVDVAVSDPIWVRVPVYVGQLGEIDPERGAGISRPGSREPRSEVTAKHVHAAPGGNPIAASVELFFELPNPDLRWQPDEKVAVRIAGRRPADVPAVPWSAIVYDVHGGTWVYVQSAPQTFTRQRVEVREVAEDFALLSRGPEPGTPIVTAGVAELFGTEFGAGK